MGPAPIEGVERMNVVVVRGARQGQGQSVGVPPKQDPYVMEVDRREIVMPTEVLGIWPIIVGIREEE